MATIQLNPWLPPDCAVNGDLKISSILAILHHCWIFGNDVIVTLSRRQNIFKLTFVWNNLECPMVEWLNLWLLNWHRDRPE